MDEVAEYASDAGRRGKCFVGRLQTSEKLLLLKRWPQKRQEAIYMRFLARSQGQRRAWFEMMALQDSLDIKEGSACAEVIRTRQRQDVPNRAEQTAIGRILGFGKKSMRMIAKAKRKTHR